MNEFEAFNVYLAFKLHFTTDRYDITKTRGAVKTKDETFYKRSDQFNFQRLAKEFGEDELPKFLIANHVDGNRWGGAFIYEEALQVYNNWRGRLQSLTKNLTDDLEEICTELAEEEVNKFDKCLISLIIERFYYEQSSNFFRFSFSVWFDIPSLFWFCFRGIRNIGCFILFFKTTVRGNF